MMNESFVCFVKMLQKEIKDETGVKFEAFQSNLFSGIKYTETKNKYL